MKFGFTISVAALLAATAPVMAGEEAPPSRHCAPRVAEMCDALPTLASIDEATWKVATYGSTVCSQSMHIETERRRRRDRLEYESNMVKAAKEKGETYTPWQPAESQADFNARTTQQCTENFAYYCGEMLKEAGNLPGDASTKTMEVLNKVCSATAAATPAAAPATTTR